MGDLYTHTFERQARSVRCASRVLSADNTRILAFDQGAIAPTFRDQGATQGKDYLQSPYSLKLRSIGWYRARNATDQPHPNFTAIGVEKFKCMMRGHYAHSSGINTMHTLTKKSRAGDLLEVNINCLFFCLQHHKTTSRLAGGFVAIHIGRVRQLFEFVVVCGHVVDLLLHSCKSIGSGYATKGWVLHRRQFIPGLCCLSRISSLSAVPLPLFTN